MKRFIRTSSEERLQHGQLTKECPLNRFSNCLAMQKLTRQCSTQWSARVMSNFHTENTSADVGFFQISRFIEMFGDPVANSKNWNISSLLSIGYCKNGMNFHTGDNGVDIRCLGVADFKNLSVIDGTENLPIVSLNELPSKDSMLKDGDIVFVRSNGNKALVGRCLLVYPHNIPTTYSGFCIRFRLTSKQVMPEYLLRVLKSDSISKKMMGRGANIQNLNQQILASLDIPIPPLDLQNQFAEFVKQTDKSKYLATLYIKLLKNERMMFCDQL